jgi:hypothetical protein
MNVAIRSALMRSPHHLHGVFDVAPLSGLFGVALVLASFGIVGRLGDSIKAVLLEHLPRDRVNLYLGYHVALLMFRHAGNRRDRCLSGHCGPIQMPLNWEVPILPATPAILHLSCEKKESGLRDFYSVSGETTPLPAGIVTQRRRDGGRHACVGECTTSCLPAARCIRATLFGKDDDLQFPPLRVHVLTRRISAVACLVCSMAQVEPLEATGS